MVVTSLDHHVQLANELAAAVKSTEAMRVHCRQERSMLRQLQALQDGSVTPGSLSLTDVAHPRSLAAARVMSAAAVTTTHLTSDGYERPTISAIPHHSHSSSSQLSEALMEEASELSVHGLRILGTPHVGNTLHAVYHGSWDTCTVSWFREPLSLPSDAGSKAALRRFDAKRGERITLAESPTYTITEGDIGHTIAVVVTPCGRLGSSGNPAAQETSAVVGWGLPEVNVALVGRAQVGEMLAIRLQNANANTAAILDVERSVVRWSVGGQTIQVGTHEYAIRKSDSGHPIVVDVIPVSRFDAHAVGKMQKITTPAVVSERHPNPTQLFLTSGSWRDDAAEVKKSGASLMPRSSICVPSSSDLALGSHGLIASAATPSTNPSDDSSGRQPWIDNLDRYPNPTLLLTSDSWRDDVAEAKEPGASLMPRSSICVPCLPLGILGASSSDLALGPPGLIAATPSTNPSDDSSGRQPWIDNLKIVGSMQVGGKMKCTYDYFGKYPEGASKFRWQYQRQSDSKWITFASGVRSIVMPEAAGGVPLRLYVVPIDKRGQAGQGAVLKSAVVMAGALTGSAWMGIIQVYNTTTKMVIHDAVLTSSLLRDYDALHAMCPQTSSSTEECRKSWIAVGFTANTTTVGSALVVAFEYGEGGVGVMGCDVGIVLGGNVLGLMGIKIGSLVVPDGRDRSVSALVGSEVLNAGFIAYRHVQ